MNNLWNKYTPGARHLGAVFLYGVLGVPVGIVCGILVAVFGLGLNVVSSFRSAHPWLLIFLPLAGLLIVFGYQTFGSKAAGGMKKVFRVGQGEEEEIPLRLIPMEISATWLVHLCGGSAGKEGVAIQISAAFSNWFAKRSKVCKDPSVFLVAGMAAGFAGLFQAPVAGTLFAMEILVAGQLQYQSLLPASVAAATSWLTARALGLGAFSFSIPSVEVTISSMLRTLLIGVLFGVVGAAFALGLHWTKKKASEIFPNAYLRIAVMSIGISVLFLLFFGDRYSSAGGELISASCSGDQVLVYDWVLKLLFTILTVSAGFHGGEVSPLCSIGASLGAVAGPLFGFEPTFAAALGLTAVLGAGTNTLLAPALLGAEFFGYDKLPFFLIACAAAYVVNQNQTIYPYQLLGKTHA